MTKLIAPSVFVIALVSCVRPHLTMSRPAATARAEAFAALGAKLFRDPSLSGTGTISCASCHDPLHAFGPPRGLAPGNRAVPSLRYLQTIPQFTEHYFDQDKGDDSLDAGPTGGLTWDGRVNRGRDQARIPLLAESEMAGGSPSAIVARIRRAAYFEDVRKLTGFTDEQVFTGALEALEIYQQNERDFYPYDSRFDAWRKGGPPLSPQEAHGYELFIDPAKGNCSSCHTAESRPGVAPQFTDYGYAALGIPANANYRDLGLCGPERKDLAQHPEYCGLFVTPSLRNVATRAVFFHNGSVHTLRDAVAFYSERDRKPDKWPVPPEVRNNIQTTAPFGGKPGDPPSLTDPEIDDIVAFLQTLTDRPAQP